MRGFVFDLCTRFEDSPLCFRGDYFRDLVAHPGGESCGPRYLHHGEASNKVWGKPKFVLSLDYKLEVSVGKWHTRRLPGGGILLRISKWMREGEVYHAVSSLPYYLSYFWLFVIQVESAALFCKPTPYSVQIVCWYMLHRSRGK